MPPFWHCTELAQCKEQVTKAPETKVAAEEELASWQEELDKLSAVQPDDAICKQIESAEVPRFEKQVAEAKTRHGKANDKLATVRRPLLLSA